MEKDLLYSLDSMKKSELNLLFLGNYDSYDAQDLNLIWFRYLNVRASAQILFLYQLQ